MLQACKDIGLKVQTADALVFLQSLPDESQLIVSGFHIVEHLPVDLLQKLVRESKRVLKPGGLLIFETPNPENVAVGTSSFYLDPTHQRPIPPELLSFLPEYYGYDRYKVLRLQEPPELARSKRPSLLEVLIGVSPDYAVVAQKSGSPSLTEALNEVFQKEYGLNLHTLAERYQQQTSEALEQAEVKAEQAVVKAEEAALFQDIYINTYCPRNLLGVTDLANIDVQVFAHLFGYLHSWISLRNFRYFTFSSSRPCCHPACLGRLLKHRNV